MFNPATLGVLIPIIAMCIPVVAIVAGAIRSWQVEHERHETIRELAKHGQPLPPELLQGSTRRVHATFGADPALAVPGAHSRRRGIILLALGLGMCPALYLLSPDRDSWVWGLGLIPLFLGVAYLVIWRLEAATPRA